MGTEKQLASYPHFDVFVVENNQYLRQQKVRNVALRYVEKTEVHLRTLLLTGRSPT